MEICLLDPVIKNLKELEQLKKKTESLIYASDFLLEAIKFCEKNKYRLPGVYLDCLPKIEDEIKLKIALGTYKMFRGFDIFYSSSADKLYEHCLLAACFAYAYCLKENL